MATIKVNKPVPVTPPPVTFTLELSVIELQILRAAIGSMNAKGTSTIITLRNQLEFALKDEGLTVYLGNEAHSPVNDLLFAIRKAEAE